MPLNVENPNVIVQLQKLMARMGSVCEKQDIIATHLCSPPVISNRSLEKCLPLSTDNEDSQDMDNLMLKDIDYTGRCIPLASTQQ